MTDFYVFTKISIRSWVDGGSIYLHLQYSSTSKLSWSIPITLDALSVSSRNLSNSYENSLWSEKRPSLISVYSLSCSWIIFFGITSLKYSSALYIFKGSVSIF